MKLSAVSLLISIFAVSQSYGSRCGGIRYSRLGCFSIEPPFDNTHWLPQRPSFVNTYFNLFTRQNPTTGQRLFPHQRQSINTSNFDTNLPTKVLIHGFLQYGSSSFVVNITEALLQLAPMNVIVVGWEGGAGFPYTQAVANTRLVGAQIARLLGTLRQVKNASMVNTHLIGHSLGAHVAGYAGARTPGLGRITGLDPAQPNYSGYPLVLRLDDSDAHFVDIIHTDGIPFDTVRGYGMIEPIGHVDFYPNGGKNQPGCHDETSVMGFFEDAFRYGMSVAESGLGCSHERSTELFLASIRHSINGSRHDQCHFKAVQCPSYESFLQGECLDCGYRGCPVMGIEASSSRARGIYYLNTTGSAEFCGFNYFVKLTTSDTAMTGVEGQISVKLTGTTADTEWTELHSGDINPGSDISGIILSQIDIGDLQGVRIRATYDRRMFSWSQGDAVLTQVRVGSLMDFITRYFCESSMTLGEGQVLELSNGHRTQTSCANYNVGILH